jgi:hypothetical protein
VVVLGGDEHVPVGLTDLGRPLALDVGLIATRGRGGVGQEGEVPFAQVDQLGREIGARGGQLGKPFGDGLADASLADGADEDLDVGRLGYGA